MTLKPHSANTLPVEDLEKCICVTVTYTHVRIHTCVCQLVYSQTLHAHISWLPIGVYAHSLYTHRDCTWRCVRIHVVIYKYAYLGSITYVQYCSQSHLTQGQVYAQTHMCSPMCAHIYLSTLRGLPDTLRLVISRVTPKTWRVSGPRFIAVSHPKQSQQSQ